MFHVSLLVCGIFLHTALHNGAHEHQLRELLVVVEEAPVHHQLQGSVQLVLGNHFLEQHSGQEAQSTAAARDVVTVSQKKRIGYGMYLLD